MNCVHGATLYTGRSIIEDAYLIFDGDKIIDVSKRKRGSQIGSFAVVTPAFVDPHSHVGMSRAGEPSNETEANEQLDTITVISDALDSIQMDDSAFADAIEMGVLYSCIVPGSANIIGGLSAVVRNYAANTTEALIARAGVKAAFGYNPISALHPYTLSGAADRIRTPASVPEPGQVAPRRVHEGRVERASV